MENNPTAACNRKTSVWRRRSAGSFSQAGPISVLDGRTKEARFLKAVRSQLALLISGHPNAAHMLLVDRGAVLRLLIGRLDEKMIRNETLTADENRNYSERWSELDRVKDSLMSGAFALVKNDS